MRGVVCMVCVTQVMVVLAAAANPAYVEEAAKWRSKYEADLKAPSGWLAVAGLWWLHEGSNSVGSDAKSDLVLPASAPGHAGAFVLAGRTITFGGKALRSDAAGHPDTVTIGDLSLTVIERDGKIGVRMRDPHAETRRSFTGSTWFPADDAWRLRAKWVAYPQAKKIPITNILGMTEDETSPGYAVFEVHGRRSGSNR